MSVLWLKRVGNALVPDADDSASQLARLPFGKALRAEVKQPRNTRHHRLYFALCHRIADAVGSTAENVSDLLKIETGHCDIIRSKKYGEIRLPKSIAFASMTQDEFSKFFERCVLCVYENWGIARADVLVAVGDLLDSKTEKRG